MCITEYVTSDEELLSQFIEFKKQYCEEFGFVKIGHVHQVKDNITVAHWKITLPNARADRIFKLMFLGKLGISEFKPSLDRLE